MKRAHRRTELRGQPGRRHGDTWRTAAALIGLALLVVAGAAAAQVYKWKDAQGGVHYGDSAPPQGAQAPQVLKVAPAPDAGAAAGLPYALARAVRQHPVTLYTAARCEACDRGRSLLRERGIPFTEKTVSTQEDQQQLRSLNGNGRVPLLLVGSRQETGLKAALWQEALDSAGYPRQTMLPAGYRYAAPEPATPSVAPSASAPASAAAPGTPVRARIKVPPDEAAAQAQAAQPRTPQRQTPPPAGNAPPNFQF
jgi:glutaredoxin